MPRRRRLGGPYKGEATCFIIEPLPPKDYYRYTCSYTWDMRFGGGEKDRRGKSFTYEVRGTIFTQEEIARVIHKDGEECWEYIHPAVKHWFEWTQESIATVYLDYYWQSPNQYHNPGEKERGYDERTMKDERNRPIHKDILYIDYMIVQKGTERLGKGYYGGIYFKRQAAIPLSFLKDGKYTIGYSTIDPEYSPYPKEKEE